MKIFVWMRVASVRSKQIAAVYTSDIASKPSFEEILPEHIDKWPLLMYTSYKQQMITLSFV